MTAPSVTIGAVGYTSSTYATKVWIKKRNYSISKDYLMTDYERNKIQDKNEGKDYERPICLIQ